MRGMGLSIPGWLAVTAIVACGDEGETGNETQEDSSEPSSSESTVSTTMDTVSTSQTTTASTTESTTDATTETTTGEDTTTDESTTAVDTTTGGPIELPDCSVHAYVAECEDEELCFWQMETGCVVECPLVTDEAQCISLEHCEWIGECEFEGVI